MTCSSSSSKQGTKMVKILRVLRAGKVVRATKMIRSTKISKVLEASSIFTSLEEFFYDTQLFSVLQIVKFFLYFSFVLHVLACCWYSVGVAGYRRGRDNWLERDDFELEIDGPADAGARYLTAIYWVCATICTVGYGDIYANNPSEKIFAVGLMMLGSVYYGLLVAKFNQFMSAIDANVRIQTEKLEHVSIYMKKHAFPRQLRQKIRWYYRNLYQHKTALDEEAIFNDLPDNIQGEVLLNLMNESVHQNVLLKNMSEQVFRQLIRFFHITFFKPGDYITRAGATGNKVFIMSHGEAICYDIYNRAIQRFLTGATFGVEVLTCDTGEPLAISKAAPQIAAPRRPHSPSHFEEKEKDQAGRTELLSGDSMERGTTTTMLLPGKGIPGGTNPNGMDTDLLADRQQRPNSQSREHMEPRCYEESVRAVSTCQLYEVPREGFYEAMKASELVVLVNRYCAALQQRTMDAEAKSQEGGTTGSPDRGSRDVTLASAMQGYGRTLFSTAPEEKRGDMSAEQGVKSVTIDVSATSFSSPLPSSNGLSNIKASTVAQGQELSDTSTATATVQGAGLTAGAEEGGEGEEMKEMKQALETLVQRIEEQEETSQQILACLTTLTDSLEHNGVGGNRLGSLSGAASSSSSGINTSSISGSGGGDAANGGRGGVAGTKTKSPRSRRLSANSVGM